MSELLSQFRIVGMHNVRTIDVRLHDSRLVLIGENGTGKSTVVNFIYFFLTRQWARLLNYRFESIEAVVGGDSVRVTREDIVPKPKDRQGEWRMPLEMRRTLSTYLRRWGPESLIEDEALLHRLANRLSVPASMARDLVLTHLGEAPQGPVREVEKIISKHVTQQILFLPTYRRIEHELKSIFPDAQEKFEGYVHARAREQHASRRYVELVEFGMQDVKETFDRTMLQIKERTRIRLSDLLGTYMSDVIRGGYENPAALERLAGLTESYVNQVLQRIPTDVLPAEDKNILLAKIGQFATHGSAENRVIAHFFSKLVDLYERQLTDEAEVRAFVGVCNEYLSGKELQYDDQEYVLRLTQHVGEQGVLQLSDLSSGEKQIVSLFSHMYLSGGKDYFVLIDEPELSLSVPWQIRFLPDIIKTGRCSGLIAVTHSPFVSDNELDLYTHALDEFILPLQ